MFLALVVVVTAYPDTSAAQMHDWIKEYHADFPAVTGRTVFNFVYSIRDRYNILRTEPIRVTKRGYQSMLDYYLKVSPLVNEPPYTRPVRTVV